MKSAVNLIESEASHRGQKWPVFIRSGAFNGKLYLDLCNDDWRVAKITKDGWKVIDSTISPIRFCRYPAMEPLPQPVRGGTIDALRPFVNIQSEDDFVLMVSWMFAALRNTGPYPLLVVFGEQGSAKSTVVKILRSLIDPSHIPMRLFPHNDVDLFIAAYHNHLRNDKLRA